MAVNELYVNFFGIGVGFNYGVCQVLYTSLGNRLRTMSSVSEFKRCSRTLKIFEYPRAIISVSDWTSSRERSP